jgi:amino acid transporter
MSVPALKRSIGFRDLVLFNVSAVLSLRWIATAAKTGPHALTLWVLAMVMFFIPQSLTVVALTERFPEEGGIYDWTKRAFGPFHGFFCGWCYWVSNLSFFPALLIAGVGAGVYIGGARGVELGKSPAFTSGVALAMLAFATWLCVAGTEKGKWLANVGGLATWIPGTILVAGGAIAWWKFGSATPINLHTLKPNLRDMGTINFWAGQAMAFAGLELAPIMAGEIRDPQRTVRRAALVSGLTIALIYIAGTAAVMVSVAPGQVDVIAGPVQAIEAAMLRLGLPPLAGVLGLLVAIASMGACGAWLAGAARLPFVAGIDHYLPPAFGRLHPRWGTPYISILTLAVPGAALLGLGFFGGTVAETYLFLQDLTLLLYFVPFVYMFLSLIRLKPGPKMTFAACVGAFTTIVALGLALVPPAEAAKPWMFFGKLAGGTLAFFAIGVWLYRRGVTSPHPSCD